jgi:hypothetical protein
LVPVTIGRTLQGGVSFPDAGFGFALQAAGSDAPIQTSSGVFFGNVGGAQDAADFEVNANEVGAESFVQIRSAASPQSYVLHFQLPVGAHLEIAQTNHPIAHDPPTAIEIVQGDTPLGYLYQPNAVDATGAPVPAHATIDGSNVVLSVSDKGADVQYPVLLDPLLAVQNSVACDDSWARWAGWSFTEWDTYENPSAQWWFGQAVDNCSYYPGLYVSMPTWNPFQAGNFGAYEIAAPAGAYISEAGWGVTDHIPLASALLMGLYEPAQGAFEGGVSTYNGSSWASGNPADYPQELVGQTVAVCTTQCPAPAVGGNEAMFGIQATVNVYTSEQKAIVGTENATVQLGDVNPPTVTGLPASTTGWVNDSGKPYNGPVTFQASGLGVQSITYPGSGLAPTTLTNSGCGDPYTVPCVTLPIPESYSFTLPEGVTDVTASATDPTGTTTTETSIMKIDRTPPTVTLSGALWNARVMDDGTDTDMLSQAYPVSVTASDGSLGSPSTERSGVSSISISVDGRQVDSLNQSCPPSSCTGTLNWSFDPSAYSPGDHTISVGATDQAGNTSSPATWTVTVANPTDYPPAIQPNSVVYSYNAGTAPTNSTIPDDYPQGFTASTGNYGGPAPYPSPYTYVYPKWTKATAENLGCQAAQQHRHGWIALHFGSMKYRNGQDETITQGTDGAWYPFSTDLQFAEAYAEGLHKCNLSGLVALAMTVANDVQNTTALGADWGTQVRNLGVFLRTHGLSTHISNVGGLDVEGTYSAPQPVFDWINGYGTTTQAFLADFGSLDSCPPSPGTNCNVPGDAPGNPTRYWTQADYFDIAASAVSFAVTSVYIPQVHYNISAREVQALSYWGYRHIGFALYVGGAESEGDTGGKGFGADAAWHALFTQLNTARGHAYTSESRLPFNLFVFQ